MKKLSTRAKQTIRKLNFSLHLELDYFTSMTYGTMKNKLENMKDVGPMTLMQVLEFHHNLQNIW